MAGNVSEWVQDLFHRDYDQAPGDGSAWETTDPYYPGERTIRNGSWHTFTPESFTATARAYSSASFESDETGFRCAR
jgi:formylglycine-generating enzyme required for sulfatase activity